ncbi:ABC transporter ATP-binding protein [Undibacterium umbellatum]|uniref:ABC transporter ATP-binding protein n=1 Tax=Undibacterium umbellatum TaxID=2762300 RepID=A0ABR6ZHH1_9BURK|nr:ABC transporter ATP-binding protein [Undibacterium umbellatum]MBC3911178.1 ABC transporter ATP-binding protein [Undibacterium umbellatum]
MASTIPANNRSHAEDSAIEVRGVSKHYGALHAVDGVDLTVKHGEIFGLIGHNGAGKSTLFKMMLGLTEPSAGEILINGTAVTGSDFRHTRRQLGYLPENVVLYDNLSGIETLKFFAKLKGAPIEQCAPMLEQVGLAHALNRPLREYSKGMRQRLGFAQALLGKPRVLFLDEPTNGLDPQAIRDFYITLHDLRDTGVTVIITSHILAELQERVDRLAIMSAGKIQALGSVTQLREQMHMPLLVTLCLAPNDVPLAQDALSHLPDVTCTISGNSLVVRCPRNSKMEVLAAVSHLGSKLIDLSIQEPSLEDVFFGFSN